MSATTNDISPAPDPRTPTQPMNSASGKTYTWFAQCLVSPISLGTAAYPLSHGLGRRPAS